MKSKDYSFLVLIVLVFVAGAAAADVSSASSRRRRIPQHHHHHIHKLLQYKETKQQNQQLRQFWGKSGSSDININSNSNSNISSSSSSSISRGGGGSSSSSSGCCSDSTPILFIKIATSAAVETILMFGVLLKLSSFVASKNNNNNNNNNNYLSSIIRTIIISCIAFGSSNFGTIVDNGLSAATKQVLSPNQVPGDTNWYNKLKKPSWNPPGWLFPIMWLVISKPTQVIAVTKLLVSTSAAAATTTVETSSSSSSRIDLALLTYCAHLALGDAWNKVFFGLQCTGQGVVVITGFWFVLWSTAFLFYSIEPKAGLYLLPTCLWVTVAMTLNWSIYLLNK